MCKDWTDEFGGVYTADKKLLLKVPDVIRYRIAEGCEDLDEHAFDDCKVLESLYMPLSYTEEAIDKTAELMPESMGNFCVWDRPYVEEIYDVNEYVVYANEGRRLIMATRPVIGKDYVVPEGVLTICDGAFTFCKDYLVLSLPWSIKVIGDYIFGKEGGRMVIRDKYGRKQPIAL